MLSAAHKSQLSVVAGVLARSPGRSDNGAMRKLIREFLATFEGTRQAITLRMLEDRPAQLRMFDDRPISFETDEGWRVERLSPGRYEIWMTKAPLVAEGGP